MEFIRGIDNLKPHHLNCVATIGNFDGLHRGHQTLLQALRASAQSYRLPTLVISFEPLPHEYFNAASPWPRLTNWREKYALLKAEKIDYLLSLNFNHGFAMLPAMTFIQEILVKRLHIRHLIVGDDFRFGCHRQGDIALLESAGHHHHFTVTGMPTFALGGERVSSRRIRELLAEGDLKNAHTLLGRPYCLSGRVRHGDKRGRLLGFPTANIALQRSALPLRGVFAVKVHGLATTPLPGVANIGYRPTVTGAQQALLEVHLFNFNAEIYGQYLQVEFVKKIRNEHKFTDIAALTTQIKQDVANAQKLLPILSL